MSTDKSKEQANRESIGRQLWYELALNTRANGEDSFSPPQYYHDKNVAIVIGENLGQGDKKFMLQDIYVNKLNRFAGELESGTRIKLEDGGDARILALTLIASKMTTATKAMLCLDNLPSIL